MEKLRNYATIVEVGRFIREAEGMIERYGWQKQTVAPYGRPESVYKIISQLKDYPVCTKGSKLYLISLANGLADVFNAWEAYELQPKVKIRHVKSGKIKEVGTDLAEAFVEDGAYEFV